jgi:DNA-binding transcriptional LysR family regulator
MATPMRDIKLSSLRICLEVARYESLTAAAASLNMTQSAISKNVLHVEARLGIKLFRRTKDGVIPLDHAHHFLSGVAEGIHAIDVAVADLAQSDGRSALRIIAPPIIAQRFIIPHLHDLYELHPGLELVFRVRTTATQRIADTDAEIFFGGGGSVPDSAQWLAGDTFWVVAHPDLAPEGTSFDNLAGFPLLEHVKVQRAWSSVAGRFGLEFGRAKFHEYAQYSLIIDAALQGQGVAIVPRFLVREAVNEGRLRKIGDEVELPRMGYYYQLIRRDKIIISNRFSDWLKGVLRHTEG